MHSRVAFYLCLWSLFFADPVFAQPEDTPASLFAAPGSASSTAMTAQARERMETLTSNSMTQSIRVVRIAGNLSQRRTLILQVSQSRNLEPDAHPVFERHPGNGKGLAQHEAREARRTKLFVRREQIIAIGDEGFAWSGSVRIGPGKRTVVGDITLVQNLDGEVTGTIQLEGEFFNVRPLDSGLHALVEVDEAKYPQRSAGSPRNDGSKADASAHSQSSSEELHANRTDLVHSSRRPARDASAVSPHMCSLEDKLFPRGGPGFLTGITFPADGGLLAGRFHSRVPSPADPTPCQQAFIDVLVLYTPNAASGRDIDGIINTAVIESNQTYSNSDTNSRKLNVAYTQQIQIPGIGIGGIQDDLRDFRTNATVKSLRNQYDADLIVLLTDAGYFVPDGQIAGIADEIRAEEQDAYALVEVPFATGGAYTFTHEVGHLQGAQHNPSAACALGDPDCDFEGDLIPQAFGHRFDYDDCELWVFDCDRAYYRTMMAYNEVGGSRTRIKHFSNPDVDFRGVATGTGHRDNANALAITDYAVKTFRTPNDLSARFSVSGTYTSAERTFTSGPCGGTDPYAYEWRISYNENGNFGSVIGRQEDLILQSLPAGTHFMKLTVISGSQTDSQIRSFDVPEQSGCGLLPCPSENTSFVTTGQQSAETNVISGRVASLPSEIALHAPSPHPVSSSAQITFDLPEPIPVQLKVYDLLGREVTTLTDRTMRAGTHHVRLNGRSLTSGTYLVRLKAGADVRTTKLTVVR